jgi:hypothetical protein
MLNCQMFHFYIRHEILSRSGRGYLCDLSSFFLKFYFLIMQVSESAFKDHSAVFESLQWDILKETGYLSWFELAFTLAGYLSTHCGEGEGPTHQKTGNKWAAIKTKSDVILDQLDELKSCLEADSDIYKLAAGTLVYCCSVIQHLEKRPDK